MTAVELCCLQCTQWLWRVHNSGTSSFVASCRVVGILEAPTVVVTKLDLSALSFSLGRSLLTDLLACLVKSTVESFDMQLLSFQANHFVAILEKMCIVACFFHCNEKDSLTFHIITLFYACMCEDG